MAAAAALLTPPGHRPVRIDPVTARRNLEQPDAMET